MPLAACPSPGTCWNPGPIPWWVGLIYAAVAVAAGLIIFLAEDGKPRMGAVAAWLGSVVLFAAIVEAVSLYAASTALK